VRRDVTIGKVGEVKGGSLQVGVRVNQAREHGFATEIDPPRVRWRLVANAINRTDGRDPSISKEHRLGDSLLRVQRPDQAIFQEQRRTHQVFPFKLGGDSSPTHVNIEGRLYERNGDTSTGGEPVAPGAVRCYAKSK
jgi:hypothetical protein